jgi:hypothetical protein
MPEYLLLFRHNLRDEDFRLPEVQSACRRTGAAAHGLARHWTAADDDAGPCEGGSASGGACAGAPGEGQASGAGQAGDEGQASGEGPGFENGGGTWESAYPYYLIRFASDAEAARAVHECSLVKLCVRVWARGGDYDACAAALGQGVARTADSVGGDDDYDDAAAAGCVAEGEIGFVAGRCFIFMFLFCGTIHLSCGKLCV